MISIAETKTRVHTAAHITVWFISTETVKVAGYFAIAGTLSLAVFCILSIVQLAMVVSKEKVVFAYSKTVVTKLVFAFAASKLYTRRLCCAIFDQRVNVISFYFFFFLFLRLTPRFQLCWPSSQRGCSLCRPTTKTTAT